MSLLHFIWGFVFSGLWGAEGAPTGAPGEQPTLDASLHPDPLG